MQTKQPSHLQLISPDMQQLDQVIERCLSSDVALIGQVTKHIIFAGGKRLRPALLLLLCKALGYQGSQQHNLAAVIELIHTSTLLHDDVVDESSLRRGKPTANNLFGNAASVLVGDFLYSRAFQMMVAADSMRVMQILAETTNTIAEGEVLQLINMHDANLSMDDYLTTIRAKTAKLFEASALLAAVLHQATAEIEQACAQYGDALGVAFQIIDDTLDYEGDMEQLGKNLGDDLREGKVTLPIIFALQLAEPSQQQQIRNAIEQGGDSEDLSQILASIRSCGALTKAKEVAQQHAQRAIAAAEQLPKNIYSQALLDLAQNLLQRRN